MTWFSSAWRKTTISMINVLHILRTTSPANIFGCVFLCSYPGSNMYSSGHDHVGYDLAGLSSHCFLVWCRLQVGIFYYTYA
jgi:hypothetical protein